MNEETVTIPKREYESLQDDSLKLTAMESAGVDNWCGYDFAMDTYRELKDGSL